MTLIDLGEVKGDKGDTGDKGAKGDQGVQGVGIESIEQVDNDTFRICLTDGNSYDIDIGSVSVSIDTSFPSTTSDSHVPSTKLVKNSLDAKQATLVSGTNIKTINSTSLLGSGNIDIQGSNVTKTSDLTNDGSDGTDAYVEFGDLSDVATSGSYNDLDDQPTIPSKTSDLNNDSNFISTSNTSGLIKNDGTIMTSGTGSSNWEVGNHTHSGYVSATKVTSWSSTVSDSNVPSEKLVKDTIDSLIGEAISYIQQ